MLIFFGVKYIMVSKTCMQILTFIAHRAMNDCLAFTTTTLQLVLAHPWQRRSTPICEEDAGRLDFLKTVHLQD